MAEGDHSEHGIDYGDEIDAATFEQILEMDDDEDDREFSRNIVFDFFQQASTTIESMTRALEEKDAEELSKLGHFLKGSAATLGLTRVKASCEKIQNWGALKDELGDTPLDKATCLKHIKDILPEVEDDCNRAEVRLKSFYAT